MKFVRFFMRWVTRTLLHASLVLVIGSFSFVLLAGNKQVTKETLSTTGVYQDIVPAVLDEAQKQSDATNNSLPLRDPAVREIIYAAFSPQLLQAKTELFIDAGYGWLEGDNASFVFSIDLSEPKNTAISGISAYAANRVLSLPLCETAPGTINVFLVTCRPPGFSADFIQAEVAADLQAVDAFSDVVFTQEDLPRNAEGKLLTEQFTYIPTLFQLMKLSIIPSIVLFLIVSCVYVWVRLPVIKGLRSLGRDLFTNGVFLIVITIIFGYVLPRYTGSIIRSGSGLNAVFNRVFDVYADKFDTIVMNVAIQVTAVGLTLLLISYIITKNKGYKNLPERSGVTSSVSQPDYTAQRRSHSSLPPVVSSELLQHKKSNKKKSGKRRQFGGTL